MWILVYGLMKRFFIWIFSCIYIHVSVFVYLHVYSIHVIDFSSFNFRASAYLSIYIGSVRSFDKYIKERSLVFLKNYGLSKFLLWSLLNSVKNQLNQDL